MTMPLRRRPFAAPCAAAFALAAAFVIAPAALHADDKPAQWVDYKGAADKPGSGKKVVLIAGDEEYRSEEALPQLGKILSQHHGFDCRVVFSIDPKTGAIDPNNQNNIPGLEALADADLMVIATRFRDLPDEQMKHIDDFIKAGKPVIGMRTATHAFNIKGDKTYRHYSFNFNGDPKEWKQGFGEQILGETWISHWGHHKREGCLGKIADGAEGHPILNGIADGDIWGPTDTYEAAPPEGSKILVLGLVQKDVAFDGSDRWFGMKPTDPVLDNDDPAAKKGGNRKKNDPAQPVAWIKPYQIPDGKEGTAFTTTMGAATDLESEGVRRMLVNAAYHLTGLDVPEKADVALVGEFTPTAYGFNGFKKGVMPAEHEMK